MGMSDFRNDLFKKGRFILMNVITNESCAEAVEFIMYHNNLPKEDRLAKLYLYINSGGGTVYDGLSLINAIQSSNIPVVTIGTGRLMPMGIMIFITGHERLLQKDAIVMTHQWSVSTGYQKSHEHGASIEKNKITDRLFLDLFNRHTTATEEEIKSKLFGTTDYYFNARTAKQLGMADRVVTKIPM